MKVSLFRLAVVLTIAWLSLGSTTYAQTWTGSWTNQPVSSTPASTPGARAWVDMITDPIAGRPVLFAGSGGTYTNDVLQLDLTGQTWVSVEPLVLKPTSALGPPCPRDEYALEFDPVNRLYWSFGGSGYTCSGFSGTATTGSTTTKIVDPTLAGSTVDFYKDWIVTVPGPNTYFSYVQSYDPTTKTLTLSPANPNVIPGKTYGITIQASGGTWAYNPSTHAWLGQEAPSFGYTGAKPRSRLSPAMAYSATDKVMIMFGGMTYGDTWALDVTTKTWVQMLADGAAGSPPRRAQVTNSMAYDSVNNAFVLFGGQCSESVSCNGTAPNNFLNDTWVYRVATNSWTKMSPPSSPTPRAQHTLSYDPVNRVIVMFGGLAQSNTVLNELWVYDLAANTWTQINLTNLPPARKLHAMTYDSTSARHVVYGGNAATSTLSDVWTLSLQRSGITSSPPTASFTVNPSSGGTTSTAFAFDASASSAAAGSTISSYSWNFGDGSAPGTGVTTTHQYAGANSYTVVLTATDNGGRTGTTSKVVSVATATPAPGILFTKQVTGLITNGGTVTSVTANGSAVSFTNGTGGAYSFTLTAATQTTFVVSITASNGSTSPVTQTINISIP